MSTRSHIQFKMQGRKFQVYKQSDGYPSYTIPQIQRFIKWNGSRIDDLEYTIANFFAWAKIEGVLHRIQRNREDPTWKSSSDFGSFEEYFEDPEGSHMGLLWTGFGITDPTDKIIEEWLYIVDLDKKHIEIVSEINENVIIGFDDKLSLKQLMVLEN